MPTRVITVTSGKGGVGKTTTTANLGVALARLGKRVVVIDTDIGLRNLDVIMGLQNRIIYDIVDLVEGRCRVRQALIRDRQCCPSSTCCRRHRVATSRRSARPIWSASVINCAAIAISSSSTRPPGLSWGSEMPWLRRTSSSW